MQDFEPINRAYNDTFRADHLSIGVVVPIESYPKGPLPTMQEHVERVQLIEQLGFSALWVRDIPFHVPSFGDAGQLYDPFTYLGYLAALTDKISLGISSIALPLHHPVHVAKAASSIDALSGGRLLLGVASGDRPVEYPAMNIDFEKRGELFRDGFEYLRKATLSYPRHESSHYGRLEGHMDILPKPTGNRLPLLITGQSRQSIKWNAENGDGWMNYPKNLLQQKLQLAEWRSMIPTDHPNKPFMQPLYVKLHDNDDFKPQPIHLGLHVGINYLKDYLAHLQEIGVNHVALNFRFHTAAMKRTLEKIGTQLLPVFHLQNQEEPNHS